MPDHEFVFAVELSDEAPFDEMLGALASAVLAQAGYESAAAGELTRAIRDALAAGAGPGGGRRCDIRFEARGGTLQVVVAFDGAPGWRTTRPLP